MFDCGPATTHKLVKAGLKPTWISHLFFTHHHFDHNADYPCFLLCRWDQCTGREQPLHVYGPEPTRLFTERLIGEDGAFVWDWKARVGWPTSQRVFVNRGGTLPRPAPSVVVENLAPGARVVHGPWTATAGHASHAQPWLHSLTYRLDCGGWSIVFAGDTARTREVTDIAAGAAVLIVNCWDFQGNMENNGEAAGQTGTRDAAVLAEESGARTLVLTHIGRRLAEPGGRERATADISRIFSGEVIVADELMRLDLE